MTANDKQPTWIELLTYLYHLIYSLDEQSGRKDNIALRSTHYNNMHWLRQNGLLEDYFETIEKLRKEGEDK